MEKPEKNGRTDKEFKQSRRDFLGGMVSGAGIGLAGGELLKTHLAARAQEPKVENAEKMAQGDMIERFVFTLADQMNETAREGAIDREPLNAALERFIHEFARAYHPTEVYPNSKNTLNDMAIRSDAISWAMNAAQLVFMERNDPRPYRFLYEAAVADRHAAMRLSSPPEQKFDTI